MATLADARRKQESRSKRSRAQDARQTSKKVVQPTDKKGVASWLKNSGRRSDIRGIDSAGSGRAVAKPKTTTAAAFRERKDWIVSWKQNGYKNRRYDKNLSWSGAQRVAQTLRGYNSVSDIRISYPGATKTVWSPRAKAYVRK